VVAKKIKNRVKLAYEARLCWPTTELAEVLYYDGWKWMDYGRGRITR